MDLKKTGCEDGRWIKLAQDRVQRRAFVGSINWVEPSGSATRELVS